MKKIFYLTALVVLVFASCTKSGNTPNGERKYSFSIGASKEGDTNNASGTRLEMINGMLHWSVGDRVGMFAARHMTYGDLLLDDFAMDGQHTDPVKSTTFMGQLTYDQISQFEEDGAYTFTSYHPYDMYVQFSNVDGHTQDMLQFEIPRTMELTPNVFPSDYAFMYARNSGHSPLTWLDESDQQQWHDGAVTFSYQHVLSYMRVKIANANSPVVHIDMSTQYGNMNLSDTYDISLNESEIEDDYIRSFGGHPANLTRDIYIPDGLDVGDELYIPMIPAYYRYPITFSFSFEDGITYHTKIVPQLSLQRGKIHTITFTFGYHIEHDSYELQDYSEGQDLGSY